MKKEKALSVLAPCLAVLMVMGLLAGCSSGSSSSSSSGATSSGASLSEADSSTSTDDSSAPEESENTTQTLAEKLEGLTEDEYDGLTITAEVDSTATYAPGDAIPVKVTIENTGEETIVYVQGSGSFTTPTALFADAEALQVVKAQDQLGVATMDYRTQELAPGESLEFTLYLMAIDPSEAFDDYAYELNGEELYIAEMSWDELSKRYTDLVAAQPGEYEGGVYFRYYVKNAGNGDAKSDSTDDSDSNSEVDVINGATGYSKALFTIAVAEKSG